MSSSPPKQQQPTPRFSHGSDAASSEKALSVLLVSSDGRGGGGRWTLTADGEGVERTFRFKTFAKTWDFMTAVSLQCKLKNHHPEWSNVFNTTFIRWTTHNPKGLSSKDLDLAATCDALARDFGEVVEESTKDQDADADASCRLSSLADKAVTGSGDCCK
ncbi:pterin 4 alpha carbinolamine dehydratase [Schizothecium vesticola]|uniref:4a-hydroxytetrahydrobiopterin dehydratase n=1 Tax=Schizothecium vesticola TaxID=314040 RepID=A0AA40K9J0_9PEZI|nr:pterin 4 alpha carbinolamine dehydratase [Schizothecium vesticola]